MHTKSKLLLGGMVMLSLCRPLIAQTSVDADRPTGQPGPAVTKSLVNSTAVSLDYRVDRVGPSGIGKVEIWVTPDQGVTWRRLAEETARKSPFQITLPGEGVLGIRLLAVNGNGFGGGMPKRGDDAHFWVEVDSTTPLVQFGALDAYTDGMNLNICWVAHDRNLGSAPVSLFYRSETDQTWQPIARNIKNSGQHRWQFPRDKGDRFYIRVQVTDEAGNVSHADTPTPLVLDMVEPQLIVTGVTVNANPTRSYAPAVQPNPPTQTPVAPSQPTAPNTTADNLLQSLPPSNSSLDK